MRKFESIDPLIINSVRRVPKQTHEVGNSSSLIGLWILLPLAVSGFAFVGLQIIFSLFLTHLDIESWQQVFILTWYLISIICQAFYWMWITQSLGMSAFVGLWSLVPIIGWFKTYKFALTRVRNVNNHLNYMTSDLGEDVATHREPEHGFAAEALTASEVSVKELLTKRPLGFSASHSQKFQKASEKYVNFKIFTKSRKFLITRWKFLLIGPVVVVVVILLGTYVARPYYYDYRSKEAAVELISALQDVMELSDARTLEFSNYSEKLDPLMDEYLKTGSKVLFTKNTKCSSGEYHNLRKTFAELRTRDNNFHLYPETIMGMLNTYVKSCG